MTITRINVWSGPRNISTALMYSFAQRPDTTVFDEPLYGYYLAHYPAREYHPGAEETIATMENDGTKVIRETILGDHDTPVVFFKNMTHHLPGLDWSFMEKTVNVLLTRDPVDMLPSFAKNVDMPSMVDVGYKAHIELLDYLRSIGQDPPILDSKQVLLNPRKVLTELCNKIGIHFDDNMLSWQAGPRPEDGSWATYWYASVHKSTGFMAYKPKTEPFPKRLRPLLEECQPYYEQLAALAIQA